MKKEMLVITIKSIAKHFGISTAAVSKALHGHKGVSEELREEIVQYARKNNYVPDMYGRGLKGETLKVLGIIISDNTNPTYSRLVKGIEAEAETQGYNVILCNSNESYQREKMQINSLLYKKVDGLLIVPSPKGETEGNDRYDMLEQLNVPYVCINRTLEGCVCAVIKSDNVYGAKMATRFLIDKGHRKIIHITSGKNISSARERIEGFCEAMQEAGLDMNGVKVYKVDDTTRESSKKGVFEILKDNDDFTAIFTFNDNLAFAVMQVLKNKGKKIPEDVAVIGYDDNDFADICTVPLTTVPQDSYYIGQLAVKTLLDRITAQATQLIELLVKPEKIVERESV
jgi:LacI family transcriptional regulator